MPTPRSVAPGPLSSTYHDMWAPALFVKPASPLIPGVNVPEGVQFESNAVGSAQGSPGVPRFPFPLEMGTAFVVVPSFQVVVSLWELRSTSIRVILFGGVAGLVSFFFTGAFDPPPFNVFFLSN